MSKHTPGPWRTENLYYSDIPENARVVVLAAARSDKHFGLKVAEAEFSGDLESEYHVGDRDEAEANARLIAAAPDLLEACKRMIGSLGVMVCDADSCGDIVFARAAIAKATGETR